MGGATLGLPQGDYCGWGLPPRGRGNLRLAVYVGVRLGSTPAWAGQPNVRACTRACTAVYPRVGGATLHLFHYPIQPAGLPPRGRGNPPLLNPRILYGRSTPAWAGQPFGLLPVPAVCQVYPRVGGATSTATITGSSPYGLPPRGRGNPPRKAISTVNPRSTPAWAGQPTSATGCSSSEKVYPRVGGATSSSENSSRPFAGLPPRGRGNLFESVGGTIVRRSTPAWAGQPLQDYLCLWLARVYPRVGGATLGFSF